MRYEAMLILPPDELAQERIEEIKLLMVKQGAKDIEIEDWKIRTLAYQIGNYTEGHYVLYNFSATNDIVKELDRRLKYNENVIRHLIVRKVKSS